MNVELTATAKKQLVKIPKNEAQKIARKLAALSQNPLIGKKLSGKLEGRYSLKAWPYRIIYVPQNQKETITVDVIQHRQGIYK